MRTPDWYSRILLTLIAGLVAWVAVELRVLNHQHLRAELPVSALSATGPAYRPTTVAWRQPEAAPAQAPDDIINVRIVGYTLRSGGGAFITPVDLGACSDCTTGLPVTTK